MSRSIVFDKQPAKYNIYSIAFERNCLFNRGVSQSVENRAHERELDRQFN